MPRLLVCLIVFLVSMAVAEPIYPTQEKFDPGEAVIELARQRGIPLSGVLEDQGRNRPEIGDRGVVLVSLRKGRRVEQWLVTFTVTAFSAEERAGLAESPPRSFMLHASNGESFEFINDPVPVDVWVAGPLRLDESRISRAVSRVKEQRARFTVNREYLSIGLARAAAAIMQLRGDDGNLGVSLSGAPYPEEQVTATRQALAQRGVSDEEVGFIARSAPSLMEYVNITARTPGLRDIMFEVVDIPWMSFVANLGVDAIAVSTDGSNVRRAPGAEDVFIVPLQVSINGNLALMVEMRTEPPVAPGSVLAGVTELYAGRPNGKKARVAIRLLSADTLAVSEN